MSLIGVFEVRKDLEDFMLSLCVFVLGCGREMDKEPPYSVKRGIVVVIRSVLGVGGLMCLIDLFRKMVLVACYGWRFFVKVG